MWHWYVKCLNRQSACLWYKLWEFQRYTFQNTRDLFFFSIKNTTEKNKTHARVGVTGQKRTRQSTKVFNTFTRSKIDFRFWMSMAKNSNDNVWPDQTFLEKVDLLFWNKGISSTDFIELLSNKHDNRSIQLDLREGAQVVGHPSFWLVSHFKFFFKIIIFKNFATYAILRRFYVFIVFFYSGFNSEVPQSIQFSFSNNNHYFRFKKTHLDVLFNDV